MTEKESFYESYNDQYPHLLNSKASVGRLPHVLAFIYRTFNEIYLPLGLRPGHSILDIGCSIGELCYYLRLLGGIKTYGIDINYAALKTGNTLFPNNIYFNALGEHLPFRNKAFDFVITRDVFEHFPTPELAERALQEMIRVCRSDVMLHIITVLEDHNYIHKDPTHKIKETARWWEKWFKDHGWNTKPPHTKTYPIRYRFRIKLYQLHGFFLLERNSS